MKRNKRRERKALKAGLTIPPQGQHRLAIYLSKLYDRLKDYEPEVEYQHRLDQISRTLNGQHHRQQEDASSSPSISLPGSTTWRRLLAAKSSRDTLALTRRLTSRESALQLRSPKGLMLHGEVGTGKSMLIDLFADCLPTSKKRRWHFNTFMLETFSKLETLRREREREAARGVRKSVMAVEDDDYSLLFLARELVQQSPILFLDEFQMPDRVASKILTNLMTGFFHLGGVLVATSNRMPEELAKAAGIAFGPPPDPPAGIFGGGGWGFGARRKNLPRLAAGYNEFAAFLEVLKARCEVLEMEGGRDYRRSESGTVRKKEGEEEEDEKLWRVAVPGLDEEVSSGLAAVATGKKAGESGKEAVKDEVKMDDAATNATSEAPAKVKPHHYAISDSLDSASETLLPSLLAATGANSTSSITWEPTTLTVYGRTVHVPRSHPSGVTQWKFAELCRATFGPADYITLASTYHTIILTDVPILTWLMKNEARRLITLLDALYECRCKLFVQAAAGPDDLFFPEQKRTKKVIGKDGEIIEEEDTTGDSVYSETLSEVYQDATAPFRPNILTENPNYAEPEAEPDYTHARLAGLLKADALEDDPPTNVSKGSGHVSHRTTQTQAPFGRTFGRTDGEMMERAPVDPDESRFTAEGRPRGLSNNRPDFGKTSAFTGEDERFAYKRAQSRLWEMCSARWWSRQEEGWHRPLPAEVRRWERSLADREAGAEEVGKGSEVVMGGAVEDHSRDERSFKRPERPAVGAVEEKEQKKGEEQQPYSPFRTAKEPPPKFSWVHFFGTMKWGPKAGAWGQGVDGLKERKKDER